MKKTIYTIISLLTLSIAFVGCEEDDKQPLNTFLGNSGDDLQSPYVRIVVEESIVPQGDLGTAALNGVVDAPSKNVASWQLAVSLESGGVASDTIPLTTVTTFPSNISIPYTDVAAALGITVGDILGGDFIRFLGTSTGTDGSVFTFDNFTGSITGQPEQRQAFNFIVLVKCSAISDATVPGTWILELADSYGDGWDGAFLTFEVDGVSTNYTVTAGQGSAATHNVVVPAGTQELIISYTSGAFESEHSFTVETPDGDVRGPFGPAPSPCIN